MKYLSVCSGIEAATVAWHPLGWQAIAYSEIEKYPCDLLKHHYPETPNLGDITKFKEWPDYANVDVLIGGTSCQSFSVAGLRKGLHDPRGNIMLTYLAIAKRYNPRWLIWENVTGVLSSSNGKDFAALLTGLAECGFGFAYRVLDAKHFGVPQRRRRVFVVGCLGSWQRAAAVLFERHSLQRNIAPSQNKGQATARTIEKSVRSGLEVFETHPMDSRIKPMGQTCQTVTSRWGTRGLNVPVLVEPLRMVSFGEYVSDETASTIKSRDYKDATDLIINSEIPHAFKIRGGCEGGGKGCLGADNKAFTLSTHQDQQIFYKNLVRRFTPVECERLQGFPDNYTKINQKTTDSSRYKALGNSMAVPVIKWLGERISLVDSIPFEVEK